jgi:NAD(P)-dependent dehydrogenase (short-subunit alcohol dehydrogenase family)
MAEHTGKLAGTAILVTGGGTGIGRACAARLVADGARVTICGRTQSALDAAAKIIKQHSSSGGGVQVVAGDVTDEAAVKEIIAKAAQPTGSLNGVVANAGGGGMPMSYGTVDTEEFKRVLDLNVMGTLLCMKHSIPLMIDAGGGSFVGMSSLAGHVTHPFFHAYCAGKAGIEAMIRNAADEYGRLNVRFNAIRPGFVATEMMDAIPRDSEVYNSYIDNTPMGDVGQPEDVAELARFLIGPESRWITGQCINVDGGHSLRRGPDFSSFAVKEI